MRKKLVKIMAAVALALGAMAAGMPGEVWADSLEDYCYSKGGTFDGSSCIIRNITNSDCNSLNGSYSSSSQGARCTLKLRSTESGNALRNTEQNSTSNNPDNSSENGSTRSGGSNNSGGSNSTSTPTMSTPQDLYNNKTCGEGQVYTSILGGEGCTEVDQDGEWIFRILNIILTVLTYGVGIAGTLGIVISGIQYLTARDNEAQMTKAKSRLINIVIGLAAYAVMWGFLEWIIPGGILNGS